MRFLSICLAMACSGTAFGCWDCPTGKICEVVDGPWLTKAELQKYANNTCTSEAGSYERIFSISTGLTLKISCSPGGGEAVQLSPNRVLRIVGEPELDNREDLSSNGRSALHTECKSQKDCAEAHIENLKTLGEDQQIQVLDAAEEQVKNLASMDP